MKLSVAAADERLEVVRTLSEIDSDLIIKHESPVTINEIEIESASDFERGTKNPLGQV